MGCTLLDWKNIPTCPEATKTAFWGGSFIPPSSERRRLVVTLSRLTERILNALTIAGRNIAIEYLHPNLFVATVKANNLKRLVISHLTRLSLSGRFFPFIIPASIRNCLEASLDLRASFLTRSIALCNFWISASVIK